MIFPYHCCAIPIKGRLIWYEIHHLTLRFRYDTWRWFGLLASAQYMVKNKIRKSLFEQGQFLSNEYIKKASQSIQMSAIEKIDLKSSFNTLLYFPFRNEICIDIILDELDRYSCSVYMPRILTKSKMKFNSGCTHSM